MFFYGKRYRISSRILLLSDINSKIPVIIEPGNFQSILSGTGKNNGSIQYLKRANKIEENSTINLISIQNIQIIFDFIKVLVYLKFK